jgi:hypothetical protein
MRRAVASITLALLVSAIGVASPQKADGPGAGGVAVRLRGCVSGSLLKSAVIDSDSAPAGSMASSDRYRMVGSKTIKAQIKKANKMLVQVAGRITPGPQSVVKGAKMGGTSIGIGVAPGSGAMGQQAPYTPTIDVDEIEIISKECE